MVRNNYAGFDLKIYNEGESKNLKENKEEYNVSSGSKENSVNKLSMMNKLLNKQWNNIQQRDIPPNNDS